jgi:uncharacterized protein (DUF58 family)
MIRGQTVAANPVPVRVLPKLERFKAADPVPMALVYAGAHRSRLVGPGVEFGGVRPFDNSDRPRRINWRASLRSGQLQVNATSSDRASRVYVLIDSQHRAGRPGATTLDVAVRAAAGIAHHYLTAGDAVGLVEYGGRNRLLRPGVGNRQLALADDWLLDVGPLSAAVPPADRWLASQQTAGALVVALTPLLDPAAAASLIILRRNGASVVAVDTLPDDARPNSREELARLAQRVWLLDRRRLIDRLGDLGIPVVRWEGAGSLDLVLGDLARMAAAPKAALR